MREERGKIEYDEDRWIRLERWKVEDVKWDWSFEEQNDFIWTTREWTSRGRGLNSLEIRKLDWWINLRN